MIFNSIRYEATSYVNEAELDEILENAPDRFKYETMSEATARVIGEQEVNWGRLMVGVGIGELTAMQEHGLEFVNESGRIQAFIDKFVAYIKMAINKLAEITKSFIAKLSQYILTADAFIKKYEKDIKRASDKMLTDLDFNGYKFNHTLLDDKTNKYDKGDGIKTELADLKSYGNDKNITSGSGKLSETAAKKTFVDSYTEDDDFSEKVTELLFGDSEREVFDITKDIISKQITILKETKKLKDKAKANYKSAASSLQNIIKKMENKADKVEKATEYENEEKEEKAKIEEGFRNVASYYRHYASAATTYHGIHMRALSARSKQAKAICTKVVQRVIKNEGQSKRNQYRQGAGMDQKVYESYDSTAFLGAVEFI